MILKGDVRFKSSRYTCAFEFVWTVDACLFLKEVHRVPVYSEKPDSTRIQVDSATQSQSDYCFVGMPNATFRERPAGLAGVDLSRGPPKPRLAHHGMIWATGTCTGSQAAARCSIHASTCGRSGPLADTGVGWYWPASAKPLKPKAVS